MWKDRLNDGSNCICNEEELSNKLYQETYDLITKNRKTLENLVQKLMEKDTLTENEIKEVIS